VELDGNKLRKEGIYREEPEVGKILFTSFIVTLQIPLSCLLD
jgi:hypothetical protein